MINYFNLIEIEILKGGNKEWTSYIMFIAAVSSDNFYIFGGKLENKGINITLFTNLLKVILITYHLIKFWQFHCYIVIYERTHFLSQERGMGINLNIQKDVFHTDNYKRKREVLHVVQKILLTTYFWKKDVKTGVPVNLHRK